MMPKESAGLLLYRFKDGELEVFLVHPGGPFWSKRDEGSWSIPKGEFAPPESPLDAAKREFREETGMSIDGDFVTLEPVRQPSGKVVHAWAVEADCDPLAIKSNPFAMEWPRGSGKLREFPEIDRAGWFSVKEAAVKILSGQVGLLEQLKKKLTKKIRSDSTENTNKGR